jgi:hypothetical protein
MVTLSANTDSRSGVTVVAVLEWEEVHPDAEYPFERYRAVIGKREYRIFYDKDGDASGDKRYPWILVIRDHETRRDDASFPRHLLE